MGIRDRLARVTGKAGRQESGEMADGHPHGPAAEEALDVARYKYLLRVASPQLLEQVHRDAFAALPEDLLGPLYLRMCRDLPEGQQPTGVEPADLARAAVAAQHMDHGYMLRALRRPGQGVGEGHSIPGSSNRSKVPLFAGSVLGPVAAAVTASSAASEVLGGFAYSFEAAQVDPSLFARGPDIPTHGALKAAHTGVPPSAGGGGGGGS